jgi:hypothetical protein
LIHKNKKEIEIIILKILKDESSVFLKKEKNVQIKIKIIGKNINHKLNSSKLTN